MPSIGPFELLVFIVIPVFWILPSYLVARFAERRGQNFLLFLLLGLATSFVVSWILALILPPSMTGKGGIQTWTPPAHGSSAAGNTSATHLDSLERLAALHRSGALTDAEFAAQKAALLGNPAR